MFIMIPGNQSMEWDQDDVGFPGSYNIRTSSINQLCLLVLFSLITMLMKPRHLLWQSLVWRK